MQINANSGINQDYFTLSQTQKTNTTVETTSDTKSVEEQQTERYHEVLTYANTKGMSYDDVDEYFSERTEEERSQIKFMIGVSNNFSEDDIANEAIFQEAKSKVSMQSRHEFSIQMAKETMDYSLGAPNLSDVLVVSDEYIAANKAGLTNLNEKGIFMNAADKARYESGVRGSSYNDTLFSSEEAGDFLSTMTQLAKDKMEQSAGTQVYKDYKEAYERYSRMNDTYNDLVAKQEESSSVNLQV